MQDVTIITGGAGFIGCSLSQALGSTAGKIVALDNMHPQVHRSPDRPVRLHEDVELIKADVRDPDAWDSVLRRYEPKTVIHLAAETGTAQSLTESTRHSTVNVVGTTQMLDAFVRAKVMPQHIILASSRAVYGEGSWRSSNGEDFYPPPRSHERLVRSAWDFDLDGVESKALPHRAKSTFPKPTSIYGATKLAQEQIISAWASAMNVPATILRFQNVYGPGQSPFNSYTGIINIFHRVAYSGGAIDVYEDGLIGRDFVFIDDVVKAVGAAQANPPSALRLLDVGTGTATTILEAANHIASLYNAPAPIITGKFRDGDVRWAVCDTQDLASELGVRCEIDFLTAGAKVVGQWLVANGYLG